MRFGFLRYIASVLDVLLLDLKVYRWAAGGLHELWYMPDGGVRLWYRVPSQSDSKGTGRPSIFCRGTPIRESYPIRSWTGYFPCFDNSTETFERKLFAGLPKEVTHGSQIQAQ